MYNYTSFDGISIKVGQNAKENDAITLSSYPKEWWLHASGYPGSHVVVCSEENTLPKETKRDAALLAVYHSKMPKMKMSPVDLVRVEQVAKCQNSNHGEVMLDGETMRLTVFITKENTRLDRLLKNRTIS